MLTIRVSARCSFPRACDDDTAAAAFPFTRPFSVPFINTGVNDKHKLSAKANEMTVEIAALNDHRNFQYRDTDFWAWQLW